MHLRLHTVRAHFSALYIEVGRSHRDYRVFALRSRRPFFGTWRICILRMQTVGPKPEPVDVPFYF